MDSESVGNSEIELYLQNHKMTENSIKKYSESDTKTIQISCYIFVIAFNNWLYYI